MTATLLVLVWYVQTHAFVSSTAITINSSVFDDRPAMERCEDIAKLVKEDIEKNGWVVQTTCYPTGG